MKKDTVTSIWFDFGNVLLPLDVDATYAGFKALGAKKTLTQSNPLFHKWERGELAPDQFITEISNELKYAAYPNSIWQAWNAMILPLPDQVIPFLRKLSKRYTLVLVSNINHEHEMFIKRMMGPYTYSQFLKQFSAIYYSHHVGKRKPERAFFEQILKEQEAKPNEVFFIDDTAENSKAAEALGINTWCFNPQKDLIYDLHKVLSAHH